MFIHVIAIWLVPAKLVCLVKFTSETLRSSYAALYFTMVLGTQASKLTDGPNPS